MMIGNLKDILLPITTFRKNMSEIIESLKEPKVLMKNDEPKAVLIPYEAYQQIELALENQLDTILCKVAEERMKSDSFLPVDDFFNQVKTDETI